MHDLIELYDLWRSWCWLKPSDLFSVSYFFITKRNTLLLLWHILIIMWRKYCMYFYNLMREYTSWSLSQTHRKNWMLSFNFSRLYETQDKSLMIVCQSVYDKYLKTNEGDIISGHQWGFVWFYFAHSPLCHPSRKKIIHFYWLFEFCKLS
jgi:hypothetical protein